MDFKTKLAELKKKRVEASKRNRAAMVEEERLSKMPKNHDEKLKRLQKQMEEEEDRKKFSAEGRDYDREQLLTVGAEDADRWDRKKRKVNPDQGFSTYEAASKRQYDRLVRGMKVDKGRYQEEKKELGENAFYAKSGTINIGIHKDQEDDIDNMVNDLEKQIEKRAKYSRRRTHNDDEDINYINERNMRFNKKLERFYGEYTEEIKQNLERGTAV